MLFVTSNPSCPAVLPKPVLKPGPWPVRLGNRSADADDRVIWRLTRSDAAQPRRSVWPGQAHYPEISQSILRTCRILPAPRAPAERPGRGRRALPVPPACAQVRPPPSLGKRYPQGQSRGFARQRPRPHPVSTASSMIAEKKLASPGKPLYTPVSQRSATHAFRCGMLLQQSLIIRIACRAVPNGRKACGCIAQLVEQLTLNQPVLGSNPRAPTTSFSLKSLENSPEGARASPVSRSAPARWPIGMRGPASLPAPIFFPARVG